MQDSFFPTMIDPNVMPDWLNLCNEADKPNKTVKKERVSIDQKELMFEFISSNPELITHSSTKESEVELWAQLTKKLNALQPSKSCDTWRMFWKRWVSNIGSKTDSSLTVLEWKLKKFFNNLGIKNYGNVNKENTKDNVNKLTRIEEVNSKLKELEAERAKLTLEIDNMNCKIVQYKTNLKELTTTVQEKRKRVKKISMKKKILFEKKRKIEERQCSKQPLSNDKDESTKLNESNESNEKSLLNESIESDKESSSKDSDKSCKVDS